VTVETDLIAECVKESDSIDLHDRMYAPLLGLKVLEYVIRKELYNVDKCIRRRYTMLSKINYQQCPDHGGGQTYLSRRSSRSNRGQKVHSTILRLPVLPWIGIILG
jgi:hypothetical protein